jgi:hypothetical protein
MGLIILEIILAGNFCAVLHLSLMFLKTVFLVPYFLEGKVLIWCIQIQNITTVTLSETFPLMPVFDLQMIVLW